MLRFTISLTAAAVLTLAPSRALADLSLDVSPVRVEVRADPGTECTQSIQVENTGSDSLRVRVSVEDWELDFSGIPMFLPASTLPRTASNWIVAAPRDFLLNPGEQKFVRFTLKVPEGTSPGGYWSSLVVESVPLHLAESPTRQMVLRGRIATMLYVSVGNPTKSAEITGLKAFARDGATYLELVVRNSGLEFVRLAGNVESVSGGQAGSVLARVPEVPVLPGTTRRVEIALSGVSAAPHEMARLTLDIPGLGILLGECPLVPGEPLATQ